MEIIQINTKKLSNLRDLKNSNEAFNKNLTV